MQNDISDVVDGWITRYQTDRDSALLELIQFFVTATGSATEITAQLYMHISNGFEEIIKLATDDISEEFATDYPLIKASGRYRQASGVNFFVKFVGHSLGPNFFVGPET